MPAKGEVKVGKRPRPALDLAERGRPTCFSCFRPRSHCVCDLVKPFEAHCRVLVLQHPHERSKYYATAKLVSQGIRNARVLRGLEFDPRELNRLLDPVVKARLLFPGPTALPCESVNLDPESTLVILDGTWAEARKLYRVNPLLQDLPKVSFAQPLRSSYRIRKQPRDDYLSTVESISYALRLNALACGKQEYVSHYESLLHGFDRMIEQQVLYVEGTRAWGGGE